MNNSNFAQWPVIHVDNGVGAFQYGIAICAWANCLGNHDNLVSGSYHQHHYTEWQKRMLFSYLRGKEAREGEHNTVPMP